MLFELKKSVQVKVKYCFARQNNMLMRATIYVCVLPCLSCLLPIQFGLAGRRSMQHIRMYEKLKQTCNGPIHLLSNVPR